MAAAVFFVLLIGCTVTGRQGDPTVIQSFAKCSEPDPFMPEFGNRAFIAEDGLQLVVQCGDGGVLAWQASNSKVTSLGKVTLFSAAAKLGIIPSSLRCAGFNGFTDDEDCDVTDHTKDWSSYITRDRGNTSSVIAPGLEGPRRLETYSGGVLLPRAGPAKEVIIGIEGDYAKKATEFRHLLNWSALPFAKVPTRAAIFQDSETSIDEITYSDTYDLVIFGCGGAFIYTESDVAFVRAYGVDGTERWSIRKHLPKP
ncbi:MAG TPA: hypothetical protein VIF60_15955, partial [Burkholderiaceae bacterium]